MKIYVAGPYSKGDVAMNVRNALEVADQLVAMGHTPFVPHLTHFWHLVFPHPYEFWLEYDRQFIPDCDALFRMYGESNGANQEVAVAQRLGLPIYYTIDEVPYGP